MLIGLATALLLAACSPSRDWALEDVQGHLPDLEFTLVADNGKTVTADEFRGKVVLLYFGYTHCRDVCPLAMTHLHSAMQRLGAAADGARILFVSVDPDHDNPALLQRYVRLFDSRAVGLTGSVKEISELAKRYRVVFNRDPSMVNGAYEVSHSSAVFIFDRHGHARVLSNTADSVDGIAHDVARLVKQRA